MAPSRCCVTFGQVQDSGKVCRTVGKFAGLLEDKELFALGKKDVMPIRKSCVA